jgi:mRNA interferase RelE/StbE
VAYELVIQDSANKALQRIDKPVRKRIAAAIDKLMNDPRPANAVPVISVPGAWRIRVGDYRVLYEVHDSELIVLVVKIAHRSIVYDR